MNTNEQFPHDKTSEINPRLAYVLGEATETERTVIENGMQSDSANRREVSDFQQLVAAATLETRTALNANRSVDLRRTIEQQLSQTEIQVAPSSSADTKRRRNRRLWLAFIGGSLCVTGVALSPMFQSPRESARRSREVVTNDTGNSQNIVLERTTEERLTPSGDLLMTESIASYDRQSAIDLAGSREGDVKLELSHAPLKIEPVDAYLAPTTSPSNPAESLVIKGAVSERPTFTARTPATPAPSSSTPAGPKYFESSRGRGENRWSALRRSVEWLEDGTSATGGGGRGDQGKNLSEATSGEFASLARGGESGLSNSEQYRSITDNPFRAVEGEQALSTFSVDVDSASYANVRRFLQHGQRPPQDAVRIEELLNYFSYQYPQPTGPHPFAVNMESAACPWNEQHRLVRIGIKGKEMAKEKRPPSNLVFLIDVSGSMSDQDKLPLLKQGLNLLVRELTEDDRVSIITYAGDAGEKLPSTNGSDKQKIQGAIEALSAGGSTHGSAGIQMAYAKAQEHFIPGGTNRVLWATDGDLNVGVTGDEELVELVKEKAKSGVFVSVLGFGTGNLKDGKLEQIADNGNGIYAYIDSLREARRVLVEQMSGSLVTIAKDVKLQVEFNPAEVASYRLIGYENRVLATQDFHNDKKDAGDIGAGHTVTALYEIVPTANATPQPEKPLDLKYQKSVAKEPETKPKTDPAIMGELLTLKLRYKKPDENVSQLLEVPLKSDLQRFTAASTDFQFASAVASFGMILRDSPHRGSSSFDQVIEIAAAALSEDAGGYRAEFVDLVRRAKEISR